MRSVLLRRAVASRIAFQPESSVNSTKLELGFLGFCVGLPVRFGVLHSHTAKRLDLVAFVLTAPLSVV